ncbi:hypothetical protein MRB53_040682 [Persea americana]|nr:hypothetical protein MRB53_040682 [Persea americana]
MFMTTRQIRFKFPVLSKDLQRVTMSSSSEKPKASKLICKYSSTNQLSGIKPAALQPTSSDTTHPVAPGEAPPDSGQPVNNTGTHQRAAQFSVGTLRRPDLDSSPFTQFHTWFSDPALKNTVPETVTLSTAELPSGRVSSRMVTSRNSTTEAGSSTATGAQAARHRTLHRIRTHRCVSGGSRWSVRCALRDLVSG